MYLRPQQIARKQKSQQNTPSTQDDTTEVPNTQETPKSIIENIDDDISWKGENNSEYDLSDIDMEDN